jgi:hypothetical protein
LSTNSRFVLKLSDRGELGFYFAEQCERRRQMGDLLTFDKLLLPPERVISLTEAREGLSCPWEIVECPVFHGNSDLRFNPSFPTRSRRFSLSHSASSWLKLNAVERVSRKDPPEASAACHRRQRSPSYAQPMIGSVPRFDDSPGRRTATGWPGEGPVSGSLARRSPAWLGSDLAVRNSQANGLVGWKADRRLRMCNAAWLTLTHRRGDPGRDSS